VEAVAQRFEPSFDFEGVSLVLIGFLEVRALVLLPAGKIPNSGTHFITAVHRATLVPCK
jgi:hypothetical protein